MLPSEDIKNLRSSSVIHLLEIAELIAARLSWTMQVKVVNK